MTKPVPDWAGALKSLRQGKTKPLGELMKKSEHVPFEVARLLGLMLAPVTKDPGPRLEVKLPKRWTDQKTLDKYEEVSEVHKEIINALNLNGGHLKMALSDVGKDRKARGLSHSRAFLMKCWKKGVSAPDFWAVMRRRFLEMRTIPSMRSLVWQEDFARALEQVRMLLDQAPELPTSKRAKPKRVR